MSNRGGRLAGIHKRTFPIGHIDDEPIKSPVAAQAYGADVEAIGYSSATRVGLSKWGETISSKTTGRLGEQKEYKQGGKTALPQPAQ